MKSDDVLSRGVRARLLRCLDYLEAHPNHNPGFEAAEVGPRDARRVRHLRFADVAAQARAHLDEIVALTVEDIEMVAVALIPDEDERRRALREPMLAEVFAISERCDPGLDFALLMPGSAPAELGHGAEVNQPPAGIDAVEVAVWLRGTLERWHPGTMPRVMRVEPKYVEPTDEVLRELEEHEPDSAAPDGKRVVGRSVVIKRTMTLAEHVTLEAVVHAEIATILLPHPKAPTAAMMTLPSLAMRWLYVAAKAIPLATRSFMARKREKREAFADAANADARLIEAVTSRVDAAREAAGPPMTVDELAATPLVDDMTAPDASLVAHLESMACEDTDARDLAVEKLRDRNRRVVDAHSRGNGAPPWRAWLDPRHIVLALIGSVWTGVVQAKIKRNAARTDTAGLAMPVLTNLVAASRRGAQITIEGNASEILDHRGRRIGSVRIAPLIEEQHVNLAALGKLTTQRLVRHLLWEGYRRRWIEEVPDAGVIVVEGGYRALADILGMRGSKAQDEIKIALATLASIYLDSPTGEGQVFGLYHHRAHSGRKARLEMHLMGPFAPDYIARALKDHRNAQDKYLIPVPLPQHLPPFVSRERDHAPQATLQVLALRELRAKAVELADTGSVEIPESKWEQLGDEAGVSRRLLPQILDAYPVGDGERPAFLERPAAWRFRLADAYDAERTAILRAAEDIKSGARRGRASAAKRKLGQQ